MFFTSCTYDESPEMCFIGDSITHLWDTDFFFPEYTTSNHGVSGAKIDDLFTWDLSECKNIPSIILIGTNNLKAATKNDSTKALFQKVYIQKYMKLLGQIKSSNYVIISILPRDRLYEEKGALNSYIKILNDSLKKTLDQQDFQTDFIDAYPHFLKDSLIIREYYSDGLHLSEEGYRKLTSLVRKAL